VVPEEGWTTEQFQCHIVSSHDLFIGGNLALVIYLKYDGRCCVVAWLLNQLSHFMCDNGGITINSPIMYLSC
jgi:hypothetical protein